MGLLLIEGTLMNKQPTADEVYEALLKYLHFKCECRQKFREFKSLDNAKTMWFGDKENGIRGLVSKYREDIEL